jgi:2,4-dienoyl-CoA reductase (NADPH2)
LTEKMSFDKLLEPGKIGKVRTRNRIVKTCGGAEDIAGFNLAFMEGLARGGAGLIIWGDIAVEVPRGLTVPHGTRHLADNTNIPALQAIADAAHKHGCPIFAQLFHTGPQALLKEGRTISASSLTRDEIIELTASGPQAILTEDQKQELAASMNPTEPVIPEIEDLVDKFAATAARAQQAGFDGVEVNGARMHLINSFLSRAWNKRQDRYGCATMENRSRFFVEIVQEIKRRLGQDFPVSVLINGIELRIKNGITPEEAAGFAAILERAGADAIHVRAFGYHGFQGIDAGTEGIYYSDLSKPLPKELDWSRRGKGAMVPLAAAVKKVVSVPVITVGGLNAEVGEKVLEEGKADFIGMCKGLMADPELPNKVAAGRAEDIAPCTNCEDCARALMSTIRLGRFVPIRCRVNAALGYEDDYEIRPALKKKKVVVVGGGPGGMEAARVAAIRGHDVTLFEKENRLGGWLPWVALLRGLDVDVDVTVLAGYLKNQVTKLGVKIRLGEEFRPPDLGRMDADAVILATGGTYTVPPIPGSNKSNVVGINDLYRGMKDDLELMEPAIMRGLTIYWQPVGKRVAIIDGGTIEGLSLAEYLSERCRAVTLVDTGPILINEPPMDRRRSMRNVTAIPEVKYEEITGEGVRVATRDGKRLTVAADTVITATRPRLNVELWQAMQGKVPEVYLLGMDDKEPGSILNAIGNGYRVAKAI